MTKISQNLRRFRIEKRWTQRELARRSGVLQSTISRVEASLDIPRRATVLKLAQALDKDPLSLYEKPGPYEKNKIHSLENIRRARQTTLEDAIKLEHGDAFTVKSCKKDAWFYFLFVLAVVACALWFLMLYVMITSNL